MLIFMEGFDTASDPLKRGWSWDTSPTGSVVGGRQSGNAIRINFGQVSLGRAITMASTTIIGFAYQFSANQSATMPLLWINQSAFDVNVVAFIKLTTANKLQVTTGAGTVIATGTTTLAANTWYYIELKLTVNGASGACALQLNGVSEIATTTGNFGSTNPGFLQLPHPQSNGSVFFDDLYVCDTTGSRNNDFLGNCHIETLFPNGDGTHTDWSPNSGTTHYTQVDDASGTYPDGDTSYVSDATSGDRDTYTVPSLQTLAPSIFGVQTSMYARKDDAPARSIARVIRQGGVDYDGTSKALTNSYADYRQIDETDPTGAAWTIANVNGDEFGVKDV